MPVTRQAAHGAVAHIMDNILSLQANAPLRLALDQLGVETPQELLEINDEDLSSPFDDTELNDFKLRLTDIKKILLLQKWYVVQTTHDIDTWMNSTAEIFDTWRATHVLNQHQVPPVPTSSNPPTHSSAPQTDSALSYFRKRDRKAHV